MDYLLGLLLGEWEKVPKESLKIYIYMCVFFCYLRWRDFWFAFDQIYVCFKLWRIRVWCRVRWEDRVSNLKFANTILEYFLDININNNDNKGKLEFDVSMLRESSFWSVLNVMLKFREGSEILFILHFRYFFHSFCYALVSSRKRIVILNFTHKLFLDVWWKLFKNINLVEKLQ